MIIMIPARIGSKGIPKKALRPFLGKALLSWVVEAAIKVRDSKVFVNTDGEEIVEFIKSHYPSVNLFIRDKKLSGDEITLDELAYDFAKTISNVDKDLILTLQPTSPFISTDLINSVASKLKQQSKGSIITVSKKGKLTWRKTNDVFEPLYSKRLNRQELDPIYEENGAILGCYIEELLQSKTRVNQPVLCHETSGGLDYDIDTPKDWRMATEYAKKKSIAAVFIGDKNLGSGHFNRMMSIMHFLPDFEISLIGFKLDKDFKDRCIDSNYQSFFAKDEQELLSFCAEINPGLVLLDILNTSRKLIEDIRRNENMKIVSFEDNGEGALATDLTINELYPSITSKKSILCGPEYTFLRDQFDNLNFDLPRDIDILISFGGTDPNDLTIKVISWLINGGLSNKKVVIILGLGASRQKETIEKIICEHGLKSWEIYMNVSNMANLMIRASVAITASGRTIYELAACKVNTICICQNLRQLTHLFASEVNGVQNLGYYEHVTENIFLECLKKEFSKNNIKQEVTLDFSQSKYNVLNAIRNLLK